MVGVLGVEPRTSSLSGTRSNQLSYTPGILFQVPPDSLQVLFHRSSHPEMVEPKGFEPLTFCLQSRRSGQLS